MLKTFSFCRFGAFVHGALVRAPTTTYFFLCLSYQYTDFKFNLYSILPLRGSGALCAAFGAPPATIWETTASSDGKRKKIIIWDARGAQSIASYPCLNTFGMFSVGEDSIDQRDCVVFLNTFLSVNVFNYCSRCINNRYSYYRYAMLRH